MSVVEGPPLVDEPDEPEPDESDEPEADLLERVVEVVRGTAQS